jgi:hypothetical protein
VVGRSSKDEGAGIKRAKGVSSHQCLLCRTVCDWPDLLCKPARRDTRAVLSAPSEICSAQKLRAHRRGRLRHCCFPVPVPLLPVLCRFRVACPLLSASHSHSPTPTTAPQVGHKGSRRLSGGEGAGGMGGGDKDRRWNGRQGATHASGVPTPEDIARLSSGCRRRCRARSLDAGVLVWSQ